MPTNLARNCSFKWTTYGVIPFRRLEAKLTNRVTMTLSMACDNRFTVIITSCVANHITPSSTIYPTPSEIETNHF